MLHHRIAAHAPAGRGGINTGTASAARLHRPQDPLRHAAAASGGITFCVAAIETAPAIFSNWQNEVAATTGSPPQTMSAMPADTHPLSGFRVTRALPRQRRDFMPGTPGYSNQETVS